MTLRVGYTLRGRYRLDKLLAAGGFGAVYQAWDTSLGRLCAVKENLDSSAEAQRQFEREARLLANLSHPNLPRVVDHFFIPGQGQYLVMDLIEGQDLQQMLEMHQAPLPEGQVLDWSVQVCDALAYLHSQKPPVIHRDIKPSNIKISSNDKAYLVDFGLAKTYDPRLKTTLGAQAVTPGYSPQEQYGRGTTDPRSDIYALGATLYALLTGKEPPESVQRNLGAVLTPPRALNTTISPHVERAVLKAMEMLPGQRFQTAGTFRRALQGEAFPQAKPIGPPALHPPARTSPPVDSNISWYWPVAIGLLAVVVSVFIFVGLRRRSSQSTVQVTPPAPEATRISSADGMESVYVRAGGFLMGSTEDDPDAEADEKPQKSVYLDAFWIDRTEVTNRMYKLCLQSGACRSPENEGSETRVDYFSRPEYSDYPVVWISWDDANAYCAWAGRRLPSEAEWEKAARGTQGNIYPWGNTPPDKGRLNYGNLVKDTAPVGTYPAGSSPYGAFDLSGNVWEWVSDRYAAGFYADLPGSNPVGPESGLERVIRGGSWDSPIENIRAADRNSQPASNRFDILGFRCAQSERDITPATSLSSGTFPSLVTPEPAGLPWVYTVRPGDTCSEIAQSFGVSEEDIRRTNNYPGGCENLFANQKLLIPMTTTSNPLATLASQTPPFLQGTIRTASIDKMELVYVPPGVFWMGSPDEDSEAEPDEKPRRAIYLEGFWMDRTEVTNAMYKLCVQAGSCTPPAQVSSKRRLFYFTEEAFDNYPVIYVSWTDANNYCQWAGRRLPSEAEWEKAARGVDGRTYPWGNTPPQGSQANYNYQVGDTTEVGSYPGGSSPYGVMDMAGNVLEWVADWYSQEYYFFTQVINPFGPDKGEYRVQRGGSWLSPGYTLRTAHRLWNIPSSSFEASGFRCATDIP